jgi:hypothetical protein
MKIIISILFVLVSLVLNAQVYFISGQPRNMEMTEIPVQLIEYNKEKIVINTIVSDSIPTRFIRCYNEFNLCIINTNDYLKEEFLCFLLEMNNPLYWRTFDVSKADYYSPSTYLIKQRDKTYAVFGYIGKRKEQGQIFEVVDIETMEYVDFDEKMLTGMVINGNPAGAVGGGDPLRIYANESDELVLPITVDIGNRPSLGVKLSKSHQFNISKPIMLYINNDNYLMISSKDLRKKNEHGNMHTDVWIYKKDTKVWDKLNMPGIPTFYRGFGNWMAGTVTERTKGKNKDKVTVEKKELPGKEKRNQKHGKTGTPVDYRYDSFEIYSDGQLFLYNVETKKKISINTGQGDSEVLLIEGDILYYRVYDSIYQATIKNGKIEKEQMILQDEYVPDIHWAFISKP